MPVTTYILLITVVLCLGAITAALLSANPTIAAILLPVTLLAALLLRNKARRP